MAGAAGGAGETGLDDRDLSADHAISTKWRSKILFPRLSLQPKSSAILMAVMMPREKWTDERLDDLNQKVNDGFARLDTDIRELRSEMNQGFRAVNARFDAVNRNMLAGFLMVILTILDSNAL
jgi:hypothetical protein